MRRIVCQLFVFCLLLFPSYALSWELPQNSTLAVITNKAGIAKGLAHDHFIAAKKFKSKIEYSDGSISGTVSFDVADLIVDDFALAEPLSPKFQKWGLISGPFQNLSESDRKTITASMLDKDQLFASKYSKISAKVIGVEKTAGKVKSFEGNAMVEIELSIRDAVSKKKIPCKIDWTDLKAECVGEYTFSGLGIEAYSALLGAIANADVFFLYLNTQLTKQAQ